MALLPHPLESARFVADNANHVKCDPTAAQQTAQHLLEVLKTKGTLCPISEEEEMVPSGLTDVEKLHWIFLLDTWNFCFWPKTNGASFGVLRGERLLTGYRGLCAALLRAYEDGVPICQPEFYSKATQDLVERILRSDTECTIPLLDKRWRNVQEVHQVLRKRFSSSLVEMVEEAKGDAWRLVLLVAENFPCYRDVAEFKERQVSLLKRAQIFVSDLCFMFGGKSYGKLDRMDQLTMFPDYRVPQSLQYFGVLKYSEKLLKKLRDEEELPAGSSLEVEIRCCSILSVELIREELDKQLKAAEELSERPSPPSTEIDYYMWRYAKSHSSEMDRLQLPIHHTMSCFY